MKYIEAEILASALESQIAKYPLHEAGVSIGQDAARAIYTGTIQGIIDLLKVLPEAEVIEGKVWDGRSVVLILPEWENIEEVWVQYDKVGKVMK